MEIAVFIEVVTKLGVPIAMLAYFIYKDQMREKAIDVWNQQQLDRENRMATRITEQNKQLEEQSKGFMADVLTTVQRAISTNEQACLLMERLAARLDREGERDRRSGGGAKVDRANG